MSYEMCDCYSSKFPRRIVRSYEHPYEMLWYTIWLKKTVPQVGVLRKKKRAEQLLKWAAFEHLFVLTQANNENINTMKCMLILLHVALQGHSQDFSRGMHNFSNLPPTPTPSLTGRSTHMDVVMLSFVYCEDRPGWNNLFMFYTICLHASLSIIIQDSNKNRISDVAEKSLLFWKPTFGCQKKTNSPLF